MAILSLGVYLILILSGVLIIVFYQPVFIARFIYPTVGVLLLGLALVISQWRTEVICVISALLLIFAAKTYNSQLHYQYNENSVPALNTFVENMDSEALVICDQDAVKCIVEYLYPDIMVENDTKIESMDIAGKEIYYFICDEGSLEEDRLESLDVLDYEYMGAVELMYHGFDMYKIVNER